MENQITKTCMSDWDDLDTEFQQLDEDHRQYLKKLEEVIALQKKCASGIAHHRYRLRQIQETLKPKTHKSPEEKEELTDIHDKIKERKQTFREMEESLPHKNGLYLSIILGQVNISLLSKADKYRYKQEYERFKLVITYIVMMLSLLLSIFHSYRWVDAVLHFLLVWYYCTLTIRESILVVNGSRIKGWWLTHHFISTVCAGITLIWPDGESYRSFRRQYAIYSFYLSVVQVLQYYYQSGCLYRLKTLGERHDMDITVEGFMSWMWKGLAFLLPFVFFGYFFQLYNVYVMYKLSLSPRCRDWQVMALAIIHFVLFLGNMLTTCRVIRQKIQKDGITYLKKRYRLRNAKKNK